MSETILIVEDDKMIAQGLCYALEQENFTVVHCDTIRSAKETVENNKFNLALIDMQLPDGIGFDLTELFKSHDISIIFLTVVDDEGNIVKAFEDGADDYVTKPFRLRELIARINSTLVRRNKQVTEWLTLGGVTVDTTAGKVYVNNKIVELTALEYRLLLVFVINKGQILSRSRILEILWDSGGNFVEDNTLTVYIKRLREKLGKSVSIETIRGMGYRAT